MKPWHIIVLIVVILIVFGAAKLPDIARSLGQSAKVLKKEMRELSEDNPPIEGGQYPQGQYGQPGQYQQQGQPGQFQQQPGQYVQNDGQYLQQPGHNTQNQAYQQGQASQQNGQNNQNGQNDSGTMPGLDGQNA